MNYPENFIKAINHAMLYEVGGFWSDSHPALNTGDIRSQNARRATGYVNDPVDRGGETKFGIAKRANPTVDIKSLTWVQAMQIYYDKYWIAGKCDKLPYRVAIMHFDACVNHGISRANKFLQKSVGATPDGIIGPKTLSSVNTKDQKNIITQYAQQRVNYYHTIVKNNSTQSKFLKGWLRRVTEVEAYALR